LSEVPDDGELKYQPITDYKTSRRKTMKILATKKLTLALVVLAMTAMAATASAESLLAFATRTGNLTGTAATLVALSDNGSNSLAFKTTGTNKLVNITYNAECATIGAADSWTSVIVLVDGIEASPQSGTAFALCSSNGTGKRNWRGAVRQSLITVPAAGTHIVQIQVVPVDLSGGVVEWWLGDTSIVVEQK
jgi:hypothetical protein